MDLALNAQQQILQETVERMAADRAPTQPDRLATAGEALWRDFVESEFLGLGLPDTLGGAGGGLVEVCLVVETVAYFGLTSAHLSAIILGAGLLGRVAPDLARTMMPGIVRDEVRIALAHSEPTDANPAQPSVTAIASPDGWRLTGRKATVFGAARATHLLISANGPAGPSVFLVPANHSGLGETAYKTQRGEDAADLDIDCDLSAESLLASGPETGQALGAVFDEAVTVLCWEALGAMRALVERTSEHLKVRQQFGAPLAKLQVLRHRVAEMKVAYEDAKAVAGLAMLKIGEVDGGRFASGAKAHVGLAARNVAAQAVQLHGAMGVTDETLVSTYFRRLTAFELLFGSRDYHCRRYADAAIADGLHWKGAVLS